MLMEMPRHPRASAPSQIDPDVESLSRYRPPEQPHGFGGLFSQIQLFVGCELFQVGFVRSRRHQEMTIGIGKPIEQDDAVRRLPQDHRLTRRGLVRGSSRFA